MSFDQFRGDIGRHNPVKRSMTETISSWNPHPSYDHRFKDPQTIWGAEEDGLRYDYSDRLQQYDYDKERAAAKKATEEGHEPRTAAWVEVYLSEIYGEPVKIRHIASGFNVSNGYSYQIFGTRPVKRKKKDECSE